MPAGNDHMTSARSEGKSPLSKPLMEGLDRPISRGRVENQRHAINRQGGGGKQCQVLILPLSTDGKINYERAASVDYDGSSKQQNEIERKETENSNTAFVCTYSLSNMAAPFPRATQKAGKYHFTSNRQLKHRRKMITLLKLDEPAAA
ncbi:hypothetical protein BaRGS_00012688 [Batillaria attramentaria]|uniref:Uncharacterized protein n=1 Tax=Batillaria attramentaria TaxID=370345 RepID=A0ABD0LA20_9CAEN